jgi:ketol-acid reductoisomerase
MKTALKNIQSGKFAKAWIAENEAGQPNFKALRKEGENHAIEKVGQRLRGLMPWIKKRAIKGSQASYS